MRVVFKCIKDFIMHDGEVAFSEGSIYSALSEKGRWKFPYNDFNSIHFMNENSRFYNFEDYFIGVDDENSRP